jgi:L-serine dehydratase
MEKLVKKQRNSISTTESEEVLKRYSILNDVLGPDGCGPSSSHTIAPQRIAYYAYNQLGGKPDNAEIYLFNSFATTGVGHKTDIAIIAGLLGLPTHNPDTHKARNILTKASMKIDFIEKVDKTKHPNQLEMLLTKGNTILFIEATSIGGGNFKLGKSTKTKVN